MKLQRKGEDSLTAYPIAEFEHLFHIKYRSFLTFSSEKELDTVIQHCPYILRIPQIAQENYELTAKYKQSLFNAAIPPVYVKWIDPIFEYGLFADVDLPQGAYVGEYVGQVKRLFRRERDSNPYCFQYPTKWWSFHYYAIDASREGNEMRFINHSNSPNLRPICLVDQNLLHMVFIANQAIPKDTQLTFNYTKG